MIRHTLVMTLLCAALLAAGPVHALEDDTIDQWLETMEALQDWGDQQTAVPSVDQAMDEQTGDLDFESMMRETAESNAEVREIIRDHGYESVEAWAGISSRIYRAMMAVSMPEEGAMRSEMEQVLTELENNDNISPERKEQFRARIEQQMAVLETLNEDVPEADIEAVERRQADLQPIME